ncbi:hypothetical protein ACHAPE_009948 [Trichoderma viride]
MDEPLEVGTGEEVHARCLQIPARTAIWVVIPGKNSDGDFCRHRDLDLSGSVAQLSDQAAEAAASWLQKQVGQATGRMDMNAGFGCGVAHQQDEVQVEVQVQVTVLVAVEVERVRPFIVFSRG